MPLLSRMMLWIAFLELSLGVTLGGIVFTAKGIPSILLTAWVWRPIHIELLIIGWAFNLIFGVAYWIFPRFNRAERPRAYLALIGFIALNLGILLYSLALLSLLPPLFRLIARLIEFVALLSFALHLLPRAKPFEEL